MVSNIPEETKQTLAIAKELAIKGIVPECRNIALDFFNCIEENLRPIDKNGRTLSYQELEFELNKNIIPYCIKKHDLDSCLKKYDKYHESNHKI